MKHETIVVGGTRRAIRHSCVVLINGAVVGVISHPREITRTMRQHGVTETSVNPVLAGQRRGDHFLCNGEVQIRGTALVETRLLDVAEMAIEAAVGEVA